jgi:hypothetical protein
MASEARLSWNTVHGTRLYSTSLKNLWGTPEVFDYYWYAVQKPRILLNLADLLAHVERYRLDPLHKEIGRHTR